jgi:hypothetical protein
MILDYKDFEFHMIIERLHIYKDIDEYGDKIYEIIKNSKTNKFKFTDLPVKLNISELIIELKQLPPGISGELDLDKSKKSKLGWTIYINLKNDFSLHHLKHELSHALRLTLLGKDKAVKNLNFIKSKNVFGLTKNYEIDKFFYLLYLSNDEEINARVLETKGFIDEIIKKWEVNTISKNDFIYIIQSSSVYKHSNELINYKTDEIFKNWSKNNINKLFYMIEENKSDLDKIESSNFRKLKLFIKLIKSIFSNKTGFEIEDDHIYKPKRGQKFYDKWIPKQGEKLKKRIYSLYDHYN